LYEYYVTEITKVVDGDTIDVVIDLGFDIMYKQRVRLAGIDSPESRTKDLDEKALGLEAKEFLKHRVEAATKIVIRTEKSDSTGKYGRIIGWLFLNGEHMSVNNEMIHKGYAWNYDGDTKGKDFAALKKQRDDYNNEHK
jgi:micrococcal nuclease